MLAVSVKKHFHLHQKTAFLYGELKENIFMEIPDGLKASPSQVCKLNKSIYGLKQSPRCWYTKFDYYLIKLGFNRSKYDAYLYTKFGDIILDNIC